MTGKKGRPKSGNQVRDVEVRFNLTRGDAEWFTRTALQLGFDTRAEFFTAIAERLALGRLAPAAFLMVGYQLATRAEQTGSSKGAGFFNPFAAFPPLDAVALPRPPIPMPEEEMAPAQRKKLFAYLKKELQIK